MKKALLSLICLCLLAILFSPAPVRAQAEGAQATTQAPKVEFAAIYSAANQAYLNSRYDEAMSGYGKLVEAGLVHPDLYFNMGNACYRAGRIGLAVLFFEKALVLDPADKAARSNLEMVRKELIDRVVVADGDTVGEPLWHGFIRGLSLGWLTWTFLGFHLLVFGLLILRRMLSNLALRRLIFWFNVPLLALLMVLGVLLFSRIYVQERVHHAVVVSKSVPLREGPQRSAKVLMEVHAGLKVRVLNDVDGHVRVRLVNGVEGFVPGAQIGRI